MARNSNWLLLTQSLAREATRYKLDRNLLVAAVGRQLRELTSGESGGDSIYTQHLIDLQDLSLRELVSWLWEMHESVDHCELAQQLLVAIQIDLLDGRTGPLLTGVEVAVLARIAHFYRIGPDALVSPGFVPQSIPMNGPLMERLEALVEFHNRGDKASILIPMLWLIVRNSHGNASVESLLDRLMNDSLDAV